MPPTGPRHITFWQALEQFPPIHVRILAKRANTNRRMKTLAIPDAELAETSGLSINRVREISKLDTWDTVTHAEMKAFLAGCFFDPTCSRDRSRYWQYRYICLQRKSIPFQYLKVSPKWESEFMPLVRLMKQRKQSSLESSHMFSTAANSGA